MICTRLTYMKRTLCLILTFLLTTSNLFATALEIDDMEYSSDDAVQAAYGGGDFNATGGTITTIGAEEVHTFTSRITLSA